MREKDQDRPKSVPHLVTFALTCLILALCTIICISELRRHRGISPELLSVWYGERNNVIEFASDGTGLGYIDAQSPQFFRWSESNGTLRISFEPRDKSLLMTARQFIAELLGTSVFVSDSYRIQSLECNSMTLLDSTTGDKFQFRTTKPRQAN